jgi:hypothetical protein
MTLRTPGPSKNLYDLETPTTRCKKVSPPDGLGP